MKMLNDDFDRRNYNKGYEDYDGAFRNLRTPKVSSLEYKFESETDMQGFLADNDWTIEKIKDYINVNIKCDQNKMTLIFDGNENNVLLACSFVEQLSQVKPFTSGLNRNDFEMLLSAYVKKGGNLDLFSLSQSMVALKPVGIKTKIVIPKTEKQREYMEAIDKHDVVFGIGGAGTGKTFLAIVKGIEMLLDERNPSIQQLIIYRPIVEADENLGFLPGDEKDKIQPYMQPCLDALNEILNKDDLNKLIYEGKIKMQALAYARGVTWTNSYVIIDEAQNTTVNQMKLIVTRMGFSSKLVINGDLTQRDRNEKSGLKDVIDRIHGVNYLLKTQPDIKYDVDSALLKRQLSRHPKIITFANSDVIRSDVASMFVNIYDRSDAHRNSDASYEKKIQDLTSGMF